MTDAVAPDKIAQVPGKGCLGDQHGDDLRFRTHVHGLHDRAVLDALEDAALEVRVVGIERLDLGTDDRGWPVVDDVNPVRGVEDDFGVGVEVRVGPTNPARVLLDPPA